MREILFRGKRKDNGDWICGYYCYMQILNQSGHEHVIIEVDADGHACAVDPLTVSQYTGLTDKNGKRVFIGDIVICSAGCQHQVIWEQDCGGMPAVTLSGLLDGYSWMGDEEVIGNIHDNPELLEETL